MLSNNSTYSKTTLIVLIARSGTTAIETYKSYTLYRVRRKCWFIWIGRRKHYNKLFQWHFWITSTKEGLLRMAFWSFVLNYWLCLVFKRASRWRRNSLQVDGAYWYVGPYCWSMVALRSCTFSWYVLRLDLFFNLPSAMGIFQNLSANAADFFVPWILICFDLII